MTKQPARDAAKALGSMPQQLAELESFTVGQLAEKHRELYGEPTRSRNRDYLRKRLAWRVLELAEGGLSPRSLAQIAALGDELPAKWRPRTALAPATPPPAAKSRDPRLPPPGTVLTRFHDGKKHEVTVGADSFEYEGRSFRSLSAIAREISGTPWNGWTFFGLKPAQPRAA